MNSRTVLADNTDTQNGEACSTELRFTEAPCLSVDGQSCTDFIDPDQVYTAIVSLQNAGISQSCAYKVKFQLEADGFFTQESDFATLEVFSDEAVLEAGMPAIATADLGTVLPKGIHFNLKAWIYVNDVPLCDQSSDVCLQQGTYNEHNNMQVEDTESTPGEDTESTPGEDTLNGSGASTGQEESRDESGNGAEINPTRVTTLGSGNSYDVPGIVPPVAQPTDMTCWAASATMMVSWRDQSSYSIETVMDTAGAVYRQKFDNNEGLFANEEDDFFSALGMQTEPPQSYAPEGILALLQNNGSLFVIGNEGSLDSPMLHARIITGIADTDGTFDGINVQVNDPNGGTQYSESLRTFAEKYESVAIVDTNGGFELRLQIAHF